MLIYVSADLTGLVAMAVVCVAFGSAVITGDFEDIEEAFGVSEVVTALSVSLMVVGFGCAILLPALIDTVADFFLAALDL